MRPAIALAVFACLRTARSWAKLVAKAAVSAQRPVASRAEDETGVAAVAWVRRVPKVCDRKTAVARSMRSRELASNEMAVPLAAIPAKITLEGLLTTWFTSIWACTAAPSRDFRRVWTFDVSIALPALNWYAWNSFSLRARIMAFRFRAALVIWPGSTPYELTDGGLGC